MLSIVLAAGKGTRMKSDIPKVLHKVNGKAMIQKVYETTSNFGDTLFVLGHKIDKILELFPDYNYIEQKEQLGTGHALKICKEIFSKYEKILVCYGDGPLLSKNTIDDMLELYNKENLDCVLLSCKLDNPSGYGRIIRNNDYVVDIIEEKDASEDIKIIDEVNVGVYIFKVSSLLEIIDKIDNNNKNKEYYLTDAIKLLKNSKAMLLKDKNEGIGVNSKYELSIASEILRKRKLKELMENGVTIIDINNTYIEDDVIIGKDTIIYPNTLITGKTTIADNCLIYSSQIEDSVIDSNVTIGPFAHLRKGTHLKNNVHIGNFVEIKNSTLYENVKAGHLTYIGDSLVGTNTNIGAGTITCNYDGKQKHKTTIGENCFVGSNTIFIAPVKIGNNVLTAAGSVITKNVEMGQIAFARAKQINKEKK